MTAPLAFRRITVAGRDEWLFGRPLDGAPTLLILQPLFAEMNRCRALVTDLMLALAECGVSPWSLDLPGTGESERELAETGWADWRAAVVAAAAAIAPLATVALRGGALLEPDGIARRWRFAPAPGAALLRDLMRARLASDDGERFDARALHVSLAAGVVDLAGYPLAPALSQPLAAATPAGSARTVMLEGDAGTGDHMVVGARLWRRAEPGRDRDLAETLARDILDWLPCAS